MGILVKCWQNSVSELFRAGSCCEEPEKAMECLSKIWPHRSQCTIQATAIPLHLFRLQKKIAAPKILLKLKNSNALLVSCRLCQRIFIPEGDDLQFQAFNRAKI